MTSLKVSTGYDVKHPYGLLISSKFTLEPDQIWIELLKVLQV